MEQRQIVRISSDYIKSYKEFSCGNMDIDNYLKNAAYVDTIGFDAATSLVIDGEDVVAFFTLNNNYSFDVVDPETNEIEKIYAIEIQYLGVHDKYKLKGIGKQIINYVFDICRQLNHRYVFLQSVKSAVGYYKQFGFVELELDSMPEKAVSMVADLLDEEVCESYWNP